MNFLRECQCNRKIFKHSLVVAKTASRLVEDLLDRGIKVDRGLVWAGALLHDVGRAVTADAKHGAEGARLLREAGFTEELARIVERHVGAGIPIAEAADIGLYPKNYLPETLEEKIVCYADKLVSGTKVTGIDYAVRSLAERLGPDHPSV
ncbi:HDIG domain-containing protein, partial [Candidatus Bathyarchaeota archaeon]|nr:HDIG domain-containing protein [Candidatus Bathyarchaeota archaeon]